MLSLSPDLYEVFFVVGLLLAIVLVFRMGPRYGTRGGSAVSAQQGWLPGSPADGRSQTTQAILERLGLRFQYSFYTAPDGTTWFINQIRELGGPYKLLHDGLSHVYEGKRDGYRMTLGSRFAFSGGGAPGDLHRKLESIAAIVQFDQVASPPFTFQRRRLTTSSNLLNSAALEAIAPEGFSVEGIDDHLLIIRDKWWKAGELSDDEITDFVEQAFRIADGIKRLLPQRQVEPIVAGVLPPDCGISVSPDARGAEAFTITTKKSASDLLWTLVILAIFGGGIAASVYFDVWLLLLLLVPIEVLLLRSTLDYLLGTSSIVVDRGGLRITRKWLGMGRQRDYAAADVDSMCVMPLGANRNMFTLLLKLRDGNSISMSQYIGRRECAETAVARMRTSLGQEA